MSMLRYGGNNQNPIPKSSELTPPHASEGFLNPEALEKSLAEAALPVTTEKNLETSINGAKVLFDMSFPEGSDPRLNPLIIEKGGFATRKGNYEEFTEAVAGLGYTAVNCDVVRNLPILKSIHPEHLRHPLRRQSQAIWGVSRHLKQAGFDAKPDVVGHSMGGFVALDAAMHHPGDFGAVVMMEPAGLGHGRLEIAGDLLADIATDLSQDIWQAIRHGEGAHHAVALKHIGRHLLQIAHEGTEIWAVDARDDIRKSNENNQPVHIVLGEKDRVILPRKYQAKAEAVAASVELIPVGHGAPQFWPHLSATAVQTVLNGGGSEANPALEPAS